MESQTEFIFGTFDEAMNVHKKLFEIIREKGFVTYADLYFLINKEETLCKEKWTNYGWTKLWGSKVEPIDDCINGYWVLRMPKIKKLNKKEIDNI